MKGPFLFFISLACVFYIITVIVIAHSIDKLLKKLQNYLKSNNFFSCLQKKLRRILELK